MKVNNKKYQNHLISFLCLVLCLGLTTSCQNRSSEDAAQSTSTIPAPPSYTLIIESTVPALTQTTNPTQPTELTATPSEATIPSNSIRESQIVYVSNNSGYKNIFLMNEDGSNPIQLAEGEFYDTEPTWSHDGSSIAFLRAIEEDQGQGVLTQVHVINVNDFTETNLTTSLKKEASSLAWAPDDQSLAFDAGNLNGDPTFPGKNIYVVSIDPQNLRQLTAYSPGSVGCRNPSWSPDGSYLVFNCRGLMASEMVVNSQDGSDTFGIEFLGQIDWGHWLPSGEDIAYSWGMECYLGTLAAEYMLQKGEIEFVRNPCLEDQLEDLEQEMIDFFNVIWSPTKDTRLILRSPEEMQFIDLDRAEVLLFEGNYDTVEGQISWGPREERIVFTFHDGTDFELGILDLSTEEVTQITDNEVDDLMPAWQP